jgi:hypothetical protein
MRLQASVGPTVAGVRCGCGLLRGARIWRGWAPQATAGDYLHRYESEVSRHLQGVGEFRGARLWARHGAGVPSAGAVRAVAVVVKAVSMPGDLAAILRSHAWMHAAEGLLYRQAVLAAATGYGWTAQAVGQSALPAAEQALTAVGQAAGRPWRRYEKDATRAALTLLTAADND